MSDFKAVLRAALSPLSVTLDELAVDRLCRYYELLIDWNTRMNLTALTSPEDVALKHFADSLTLLCCCDIPVNASLIDVGTGAGFPGLVLKIARPDIRLTLLDSLNKRLVFLDAVCAELRLDGVRTVHSRAEDGARTALRDSFDIATSRAVAALNVLAEFCLPYVRVGGRFLAMKGKEAASERAGAEDAITRLCGQVAAVHDFSLAHAGERSIIEIQKLAPTPEIFPRKSKAIQKKPL